MRWEKSRYLDPNSLDILHQMILQKFPVPEKLYNICYAEPPVEVKPSNSVQSYKEHNRVTGGQDIMCVIVPVSLVPTL